MLSRPLDVKLRVIGIVVGGVPNLVEPWRRLREVPEPLCELLRPVRPTLMWIGDSLILPFPLDGDG